MITQKFFGKLSDGREVYQYTISNPSIRKFKSSEMSVKNWKNLNLRAHFCDYANILGRGENGYKRIHSP